MPWQIESSTRKGLERWGGLGSSRKDREEARAGRLPKRQAEGAPVPGLEAAAAGKGTPAWRGRGGVVLRDWESARGAGQRVAARVVPRGLLSRLKIRVLLGSGDCPRGERLLEPQLSGWEIVASKPDTRAPKKPGASLAPGLSVVSDPL